MVHARRLLPAAWLALLLAASGPARALDDPHAEARAQAAAAFAAGEKAFARKDYAQAADRFEEAYRLAPHPNALWNEARALLHTGEKARAANAYARYLREAPADARDRGDATRELDGLARQLLRIDLTAPGFEVVLVDDHRVDTPSVYVEPGQHQVEGRAGETVVRVGATGDAGTAVVVALALPAPAPTPAPAPAPTPSHGWSPVVFWTAAGVTVVATAATVASGIDTLSFRSGTYDSAQTTANYDTGREKMQRTNFLLGLAIVGGVFTGVTALWLTDWHGAHETRAALVVGPGAFGLTGTFR